MKTSFGLLALVLSLTATVVADTSNTQHWHNMAGRGVGLNSVTYGTGQFMTVSGSGVLLASSDGYTWSPVTVDLSEATWDRVIFVNNRFFLLGGSIVSSTDGSDWVQHWEGEGWVADVAWGNGVYVAIGGPDGRILTSSEGQVWQPASSPIVEKDLEAITFANDLFVSVGYRYDLQRSIVLTSTDGSQWRSASVPVTEQLQDVTFGGGQFVAVGYPDWVEAPPGILVSQNGTSWQKANSISSGILFGVAYGEGHFVAVGDQVFSSEDGLNWTIDDVSTLASAYTYHDEVNHPDVPLLTRLEGGVTYGNGLFVAVGKDGAVFQPVSLNASPASSITHLGGQVTLSWPADATGYVPESAVTVNGPFGELTVAPEQQGDLMELDLEINEPQQFFRLRKP